MTREEAIEILAAYRKNAENIYRVNEDTETVEEHTVAFDMAIKVQEDLLSQGYARPRVPKGHIEGVSR